MPRNITERILKYIIIAYAVCLCGIITLLIINKNNSSSVIRTEQYESNDSTLTLNYLKDGSVRFVVTNKNSNGGYAYTADFVDDNKAIYDGSIGLPESGVYYELLIYDDSVELYNNHIPVSSFVKTSEKTEDSTS